MAGFRAHFTVAAMLGGVTATALLMGGLATPQDLLVGFTAAVVGGMLPDLDSGSSTPLNAAFAVASILLAFLVVFSQVEHYALAELVVLWLAVYLFLRLVAFRLFTRLTTHRGILHSLPAGVFFASLGAIALALLHDASPREAWLAGGFLLLGFLSHLVLDEIYSLNLFGLRAPQGVGSAMKLFSRSVAATVFMYLLAAGTFWLAPPLHGVVEVRAWQGAWERVEGRLFPQRGWFRRDG